VGSQLAWGPSQEVAVDRLAARGIALHPQTVRRLSYILAEEGLKARAQALHQGRLPPGSEDFQVKGKRVVITFDGGRLRLRYARPGRRRQSGYHGFDAPWQMPRLMVIYLIDAQGRAMRQESVDHEVASASIQGTTLEAMGCRPRLPMMSCWRNCFIRDKVSQITRSRRP